MKLKFWKILSCVAVTVLFLTGCADSFLHQNVRHEEGVNVNVESAMAERSEEVDVYVAELKSVRIQLVYEIEI